MCETQRTNIFLYLVLFLQYCKHIKNYDEYAAMLRVTSARLSLKEATERQKGFVVSVIMIANN